MAIERRLFSIKKLKYKVRIVVRLKEWKSPQLKQVKIRVTKKLPSMTRGNHSDTISSGDRSAVPEVMDIEQGIPFGFMLKDACYMAEHCGIDKCADAIIRAILNFSLLIYGLPEYSPGDVELAVFLFLEEILGIKIFEFELCVALTDGVTNFAGVVLDSRETREEILSKSHILKDTNIQVKPNFDSSWILEGFSSKWGEEENCLHSV